MADISRWAGSAYAGPEHGGSPLRAVPTAAEPAANNATVEERLVVEDGATPKERPLTDTPVIAPGVGEPGQHPYAIAAATAAASSVPGPSFIRRDPFESAPAMQGLRGRVRRVSGGKIDMKAGPTEVSRMRDRAMVCTEFSSGKTIMVIQAKGGESKTSTTIGIAGTFGTLRGTAVLAWDNNETMGTLGDRTEQGRWPVTVMDLLRDLPAFESGQASVGDFQRYTRHQLIGKFGVLASAEDPAVMQAISATDFDRLYEIARRYYPLLVIDTGNNTEATNWGAALRQADVLVIPCALASDSIRLTDRLFKQVERHGRADLIASSIAVISHHAAADARVSEQQKKEWREWLAQRTRAVIDIPYDDHIAERGVIVHDRLHPRTARAYVSLAAHVAASLKDRDTWNTPNLY